MSANGGFQAMGYAVERPPSSQGSGDGAETAIDPASNSFFMNDYKRHDDLKSMLDGNKHSLKLDAMKRIIGMIAKGKDASDLFPAVVKNVVCKNIEVKKLVYVYLTRYAEEQQELALLSISTFQRALKDPNQLIRGSALRVLSNIRVPDIVPIMMLAIREAVMDMSPFVRKVAAHAITKLYSLDPEQKEQLVEVIEKLLADKTILVAGAAIQAFDEVCPDRNDLIHKNYRKLCNLLVDVEEWGQVVIINMLTRYARTQFINPNKENMELANEDKAFYSSENSDKEDKDDEKKETLPEVQLYIMDPDHRLLLRTCKPLLQSRNAAVVMAVAQIYHHCAPRSEVALVAKALIRLLRSNKEVQYIVLSTIATMSLERKGMFEPFLKSFYVRTNDPTHVKLLKLEILTNLGTETSISTILREFQTYVTSSDKEFAASTIHAIGRCASNIPEITDTCLNGLVNLMSNRDESIVAESVVVIKKLLQIQASEHKDIIVHMAKMVDKITVPMARASILWLIGEYSDRVPKIAPDVLRKRAKEFIEEEDIVKLQILNLSAKLCITNSKQTKLLCQYVFNLAKYDQNYDIRDRARFLRQLILPGEKGGALAKHAKKIFLSTKPAPVLESQFKDRDQYQLGTLSHMLNKRAMGYRDLPTWPEVAPDPTVRNVEEEKWLETLKVHKTKYGKPGTKKTKEKSFYSDDEESSEEEGESDGGSSTGEDSSEESSEEESESTSGDEENVDKKKNKKESESEEGSESEKEESSTEESTSDEDDSEEESSDEEIPIKPQKHKQPENSITETLKKDSNVLLDLFGDIPESDTPVQTASKDVLVPVAAAVSAMSLEGSPNSKTPLKQNVTRAIFTPTKTHELLNRIKGGGLSISYKFSRTMSIFSTKMVNIELTFTNTSDKPIIKIRTGSQKLQPGMAMHEFPEISVLDAHMSTCVSMAVDFADTTQPAMFELLSEGRMKQTVSISAPVGELLKPLTLSENDFDIQQGKLKGMNENSGSCEISDAVESSLDEFVNRVYQAANALQVPSLDKNVYKFASKTMSGEHICLVLVKCDQNKANITVNCEKMVIGQMLVKDIKQTLSK